jgi:Protein kinase domain
VTEVTTASALADALRDRYHLERELGRGGMATVYLARDLRHGRMVALKLLRPELAQVLGPDRFQREIKIAAGLSHPHILPLYESGSVDVGPDGLRFYYCMPYVDGESLRSRLVRERQLPIEDALKIARELAGALRYAHEHGVIHRDLKPENVLLSGYPSRPGTVGEWHATLADFGIAKAIDAGAGERLTETGLALGTPAYMSPEQASGDGHLDHRSDLYALGCILYEMLAGQPPFSGPTAQAIMARHAVDPVPRLRTVRPAVSPAIDKVVTKALAKVPADRFGTAGEFAAALASAASAPIGVERPARRAPAWALIGTAAVLVAVASGTWLMRHPRRPPVIPSASAIAVLPFTPSAADTALTRLGRDLVLTLSASVDGVGDIRVVDPHTVLAQIPDQQTPAGLEPGIALGRRFGAGSVVYGSLVRVGPNVRLDVSLFPTDSPADTRAPLARASVTNSPDSIASLTNSISEALLRQVWQHGRPPTPSVEAALQTRSVPALRAFLEGERAMVQSKFIEATKAYERTIEADSTFWLAYARHGAARKWADVQQEPDSVIAAAAWAHRSEFPEPDRLAIELWRLGWGGDSVSAALALSKQITQRFPDNWLGWMDRADLLVHMGPHLGLTRHEAIDALERTVALAPDFVAGWEHLIWMYLQEHDTSGTARALEALTRLGAGEGLSEGCFGCDYLQQVRLLVQSDRRDDVAYHALIDSVSENVARHWWAVEPFWYGLQQPLIEVNRRALRLRRSPQNWELEYRIVLAWAARGAWDSAMVAMAEYTPGASDSTSALRNYQLVAAGVLVEALNPAEAVRFARAAWSATAISPSQRPDIAWLNGVLAARRGDRPALSAARAVLRHAGPEAALLSRSLAAFDLALEGDTRRAGQALAALEWELAERPLFGSPRELILMSFDRLAASRWLLGAGDTLQAARLLTWPEASDVSRIAVVLAPLVYLERARIEDAQGRVELARAHYQQFLRRYDMPTARHRYLVQEATLALARLPGRTPANGEAKP